MRHIQDRQPRRMQKSVVRKDLWSAGQLSASILRHQNRRMLTGRVEKHWMGCSG